jgi:hypothetical protein
LAGVARPYSVRQYIGSEAASRFATEGGAKAEQELYLEKKLLCKINPVP